MPTTREKPYLRLVKSSLQPGMARARTAPEPASVRPDAAYYERMGTYAHRIRQTDNVMAIIDILDQVLTETRALEGTSDHPLAPGKIARAELEILSLKTELEQLRGLVYVDHLTGMLNRGGLKESFTREAARADRSGSALAIALLDIDDFKALNDSHGHSAGDDALVHLARTIRKVMRPSDILVRHGGEEFLFLLPATNTEQATHALQRLQDDLDRHPLNHANKVIALSFSAGVSIRASNESLEPVIARADGALYNAKRAGKRRVYAAPETAAGGQP